MSETVIVIVLRLRSYQSDSAHSCILDSAAPLGDQATRAMMPQSHFPVTEASYCFPILIMQNTWVGKNIYAFLNHWFDSTRVQTSEVRIPQSPKTGVGRSTHSAIPPGTSE